MESLAMQMAPMVWLMWREERRGQQRRRIRKGGGIAGAGGRGRRRRRGGMQIPPLQVEVVGGISIDAVSAGAVGADGEGGEEDSTGEGAFCEN